MNKYLNKHPKTMTVLSYLLGVLLFIAAVVFMGWGIRTHNNKKLLLIAEAEYAQQQEAAYREAAEKELAEQIAFAEKVEADRVLMAKFLVGIDGFVENYGYSDGDVITYGECVINRTLNTKNGFPNTLDEVIRQPNQWVGFSESNQVIEKYYRIASKLIDEYYGNVMRPVSSEYCWVELRRDGCWLKNEFSDSPYVRTWRYSA